MEHRAKYSLWKPLRKSIILVSLLMFAVAADLGAESVNYWMTNVSGAPVRRDDKCLWDVKVSVTGSIEVTWEDKWNCHGMRTFGYIATGGSYTLTPEQSTDEDSVKEILSLYLKLESQLGKS